MAIVPIGVPQIGAGPSISSGAGTPENIIAAGIGALYLDTTTGALWHKTSGTATTGWVRTDFGGSNDKYPGLMGPVFNVKAFGAMGDGVTDDTVAIQAAIDAAEALVQTDGVPGHVFNAVRVSFPAGSYGFTGNITLASSGVILSGAGSGSARLLSLDGAGGLVLDGGAAYLRHVGLEGLSVDYTGQTMTSGTVGIDINKTSDTCFMRDVQVVFPQTNTTTNLRGVRWTDSEQWLVENVWVAYLRGVGSIAYYFDNAGLNRGNMVFNNVVARDAYIGWKNVGTNITNGLVFNAFKVVNTSSGGAQIPLYGMWFAGQTYGLTLNDPHIEGQSGGSFNFSGAGLYFDATGTAIRNAQVNNPIIERVDVGIDLGSGGGTVQHVRVWNVRFIGSETVATGFLLGAGAKDCWLVGATRQPTVTTWLTDNSVVGSGNLFAWNNSGSGADAQQWDYRGAITVGGPVRLKGYTVATLPAGAQGDTAFVTDALGPTYLATLVGGGAVVTPAFYDGTNWVAI